mmetsp:Transcript_31941/g.74791  ORF Transcript_31941/g.74791 Transcript_31941/m.74791 type:complete len:246 (-) Transcript_31941:418-1155(-)
MLPKQQRQLQLPMPGCRPVHPQHAEGVDDAESEQDRRGSVPTALDLRTAAACRVCCSCAHVELVSRHRLLQGDGCPRRHCHFRATRACGSQSKHRWRLVSAPTHVHALARALLTGISHQPLERGQSLPRKGLEMADLPGTQPYSTEMVSCLCAGRHAQVAPKMPAAAGPCQDHRALTACGPLNETVVGEAQSFQQRACDDDGGGGWSVVSDAAKPVASLWVAAAFGLRGQRQHASATCPMHRCER